MPIKNPGEIETVLGQDFRIERIVGFGNYAEVYQAVNQDNGDKVALKIYSRPINTFVRKLIDNGHKIRSQHPEIPNNRLINPFITELNSATPRVAYNFVDGVSATHQSDTAIDLTQQIKYGRSLALNTATTLDPLKNNGLIHRDIKADNIQIEPTLAHATLMDIDSLIEEGNQPDTGEFTYGTSLFMSPEQIIHDSHISPASDMFNLAATVTFYHLDWETAAIIDIGTMTTNPSIVFKKRIGSSITNSVEKQKRLLNLDRFPEEVRDQAHGLLMFIIAGLQPDPKARPANSTEVKQLLDSTRNATMYCGPVTFSI